MPATRLLSAMVATWNNVATTFTGLKLNVTDTASAAGSRLMDVQVGGASKFSVAKSGEVISAADFWVKSNGASAGIYLGTSADVFLTRDAANTLALRNGTAGNTLSVYNTYTDASNYERGVFDWAGTANTLRIGTEAAGTGTVRNIQLVAGSNSVTATVGASNLLTLNGGLTTGGAFISGGNIQLPAAGLLYFNTRTSINSPVDAVVRLSNNAGTITTDITLTGASGSGGSTANFGGNVGSGGSFIAAATGYYGFSTRNLILSPADGTTRLSNWDGTITTDITISGASAIGGSMATFGGTIVAGGTVRAAASSALEVASRVQIGSPSNGVFRFGDGTSANYQEVTLGATGVNTSLTFGGPVISVTTLRTGSFTVGTVPSASAAGAGAQIYVSDESGGAVTAFSDATNWRRVTDRAVIS